MEMKNETVYVPPLVEVLMAQVEKGFLSSGKDATPDEEHGTWV